MLFVSTGRDGRGRGRARTVCSHQARRVAAGGPVERFGLCLSFPAVGRAPGWVGRWFCGRSGRSVLPRPRAACGASRRYPVPPAVRVRALGSAPVCVPLPGLMTAAWQDTALSAAVAERERMRRVQRQRNAARSGRAAIEWYPLYRH
ncbi:hypothetical protein SSPH_04158 [Sporomusa sphaeroides DSM 2875]|uniref:Uncharacterized protein n=1 Tax=Sporomusa sphaeroides DSM 2875 TaxID=1337886 RepID=A0ABP2CBX3_9FIRM|nr:hypothetical protein SSPH_04158 [Sporomusa sphaeroides DSM 2875]